MKTVFITGANRGLGLELVKQYAQRGWHVIACCRDINSAVELSLLSLAYPTIRIHTLDVSNEFHILALTEKFADTAIDVLIHNAGVSGDECESLGNMGQNEWINVLKVNTIAPMLITQALLNSILASEDKTIIGMTSILASIDDNRSGGRYSYRASKAALNQIIKSLACELSEVGVKTMAIHPGWVQTDMGGKDGKVTVEESVEGMLNVIDNLKLKHSGSFFVYDGTQLPW
ncbi:SDR family oxidoreductase [Vibrio parahaemolyticus]|uniref:SDR family oxidoreductase n=1 Tax=Vibrio parahaemolyticus TaxID=670 RepID=UPI0006C537FC|nr:SDR family oxidoreductase [Vibrio parahaemolyticus]EHR1198940.1 SDR family oxidoreductase [Vibrio parahaemolyticus]EHR5851512.1 SDR family oxidoreductase [Vibrio parahaemolyticus]EJG1882515.1 SDR family oxidoreductase [Vibrio parahaemolyticus]KOY35690.1 curlin [Vibrio parahaemolyticus]